MRHPTKTAAGVRTALIEFVVAQTAAGQGKPVPASRIGGSFLSRPGYRAALLGTEERLMPYLSRTFSLWRDTADDHKPVNHREIYVAHASANFPPSQFTCVSRPEGDATGERRAGRAQDKSPDKRASAKKESREARSKDPSNVAATSAKKKNSTPGKTSKLSGSIDPSLRRFVKNAIKLNGCVSVSKIGGTFMSHNHALRKMLKNAKKKLPDYLSSEYSLWKMRSELSERKPSEQEVYVAARAAWLAPADFVLVSRPNSDDAADPATTLKTPSSAIQPSAKGPKEVVSKSTRQNTNQEDVETSVCRFVGTLISEAGKKPVLALGLVRRFIKEHPTLCNSKSGGRILLMMRDNFSLWQKSVPQGKDLFDGDVFVADAKTSTIQGFTLISHPKPVPPTKANAPPMESSSSNTEGDFLPDSSVPLKNTTPPGSPDARSQGGTSLFVDSKLSSPTPMNFHQSQPEPQKVFAYEGATFSNAASENLHNPWNFTARKYYESDATVKLTDALLATDLTREDLAQSFAALLAHFRQQGSFELFRDVTNHIHSEKLFTHSEQ
eukprot:g4652.t1